MVYCLEKWFLLKNTPKITCLIEKGLRDRVSHSLGGYIAHKEYETSLIFEPMEDDEISFEDGGSEELSFC